MENQEKINVLIRLLKDGHISNEEFQMLYPEKIEQVFIPSFQMDEIVDPIDDNKHLPPFIHLVNPDWLPTYINEPWHTTPWFIKSDGTVTRSN